MKTNPKRPPSDEELNRLLARGYRDTSPEFEARWVALKRDLRQQPAASAPWFSGWRLTAWFGALGACGAAALAFYLVTPRASSLPELSPQFRELLAMDAALGRAAPLLDEETRSALLHLPANGSRQN